MLSYGWNQTQSFKQTSIFNCFEKKLWSILGSNHNCLSIVTSVLLSRWSSMPHDLALCIGNSIATLRRGKVCGVGRNPQTILFFVIFRCTFSILVLLERAGRDHLSGLAHGQAVQWRMLSEGDIGSSLHSWDSWDSNGKIGSSWLVDLGGISGNIAGLSIVNLLGDNWCGLVNGGDSGSLFSSGVRCWILL